MVLVKMSYFLVQFGFFWVLNNTIQYNNSRQVIITSWRDSLRSLYKQSSIYIHTAHSIPTSVSGQGGLVTEAWGRSLPPSPPPSTFSTVDAWPLRRRGRKPLRGWGGGGFREFIYDGHRPFRIWNHNWFETLTPASLILGSFGICVPTAPSEL